MAGTLTDYRPPINRLRRLHFWAALAGETLTSRRLDRLMRLRVDTKELVTVAGLEHLPRRGNLLLALNHYQAGCTIDMLAAAAQAVEQARPDLRDRWLVIAGQRQASPSSRAVIPWLLDHGRQRWQAHLLRLPWQNQRPSIGQLRAWRARLAHQPALVFPEAQSSLTLGEMRPGTGRWLARLPVPVVPIGGWWEAGWHIRSGRPIQWSHRHELHDLQLGLNLAALLPPALAPDWQADLERWRAIHHRQATTGVGVAEPLAAHQLGPA